jgi:hypothetical protein
MGKYLYMAVTPDDYELPIAVEESAIDLANKLGIEPISVYNSINKGLDGKNVGRKIIKIKNF